MRVVAGLGAIAHLSLRYTLDRRNFTVCSVTHSFWAISPLVAPPATSWRTSSSREVSGSLSRPGPRVGRTREPEFTHGPRVPRSSREPALLARAGWVALEIAPAAPAAKTPSSQGRIHRGGQHDHCHASRRLDLRDEPRPTRSEPSRSSTNTTSGSASTIAWMDPVRASTWPSSVKAPLFRGRSRSPRRSESCPPRRPVVSSALGPPRRACSCPLVL